MFRYPVSKILWLIACTAVSHVAISGEADLGKPPQLATQSATALITQSREAYTIFQRKDLSEALASKGVSAISELGKALNHEHWHVRHCALMTLQMLAKADGNRSAMVPLVPKIADLVVKDPAIGVRWMASDCLGTMGEQGKGGQTQLAHAAVKDKEDWVRIAAATALNSINADVPVMLTVYESMIRSTDKMSRAEGISKAGRLHEKKIDISSVIPALKDVFRKPIYDANFSEETRVPAMELLNRLKVDTTELVPFIIKDLSTIWTIHENGYHPYQKLTLSIMGKLAEHGAAAIPTLEAVVADPEKFGCKRSHPDYSKFISVSKESLSEIRAALAKKGGQK